MAKQNKNSFGLELTGKTINDGIEYWDLHIPNEDGLLYQCMDCYSHLNQFVSATNLRMQKGHGAASIDEGTIRQEKMNCAYPYIPNHADEIFSQYIAATVYFEQELGGSLVKFLDAGCGVGNVLSMLLFLNNSFGSTAQVKGLELDKSLVTFGNTYLGCNSDCKNANLPIKEQDITTYTDYSQHNLIYYYCPIRNVTFQRYFEEYLEDQCDVGTILMPNLKRGQMIRTDHRFKEVVVNIPCVSRRVRLFVKTCDGERKNSRIIDSGCAEAIREFNRELRQLSISARADVERHLEKYPTLKC